MFVCSDDLLCSNYQLVHLSFFFAIRLDDRKLLCVVFIEAVMCLSTHCNIFGKASELKLWVNWTPNISLGHLKKIVFPFRSLQNTFKKCDKRVLASFTKRTRNTRLYIFLAPQSTKFIQIIQFRISSTGHDVHHIHGNFIITFFT